MAIIGIGGGSGSGKTTISNALSLAFNQDVVVLRMDNYYKCSAHLPMEERIKVNYDHPNAFDFELLVQQIQYLRQGEAVEQPMYNFVTHERMRETLTVYPSKVIILEGILALYEPSIQELLDIKVYIDTDADIRLIRRMRRDMTERGRAFVDIINQYLETAKPMYEQFVLPSKQYADVIIPRGGENHVAISMLVDKISSVIGGTSRSLSNVFH